MVSQCGHAKRSDGLRGPPYSMTALQAGQRRGEPRVSQEGRVVSIATYHTVPEVEFTFWRTGVTTCIRVPHFLRHAKLAEVSWKIVCIINGETLASGIVQLAADTALLEAVWYYV